MLKELYEILKQYQNGDCSHDALKKWLSTKSCEKWVFSLLEMEADDVIAHVLCDKLLHNIDPDLGTFNRVVSKIIIAIEEGCVEELCFYKVTRLSCSENERRVIDIAERINNQDLNNTQNNGIIMDEADISFLEAIRNRYIDDYYMLIKPVPRKSILEILITDLSLMLYDIYYINQYGTSIIPGVKIRPEEIKQDDLISRVAFITDFLCGKRNGYIHISGCKKHYYVCLI